MKAQEKEGKFLRHSKLFKYNVVIAIPNVYTREDRTLSF